MTQTTVENPQDDPAISEALTALERALDAFAKRQGDTQKSFLVVTHRRKSSHVFGNGCFCDACARRIALSIKDFTDMDSIPALKMGIH